MTYTLKTREDRVNMIGRVYMDLMTEDGLQMLVVKIDLVKADKNKSLPDEDKYCEAFRCAYFGKIGHKWAGHLICDQHAKEFESMWLMVEDV